jgi:hypothetical protein
MTPSQAQQRFATLRSDLQAGRLDQQRFAAEVAELRLQDADGRWWQIEPNSGGWLVWDGSKWAPATGAPVTGSVLTSCPRCGAAVRAGRKFCTSCGAALDEAATAPIVPESKPAPNRPESGWGQHAWDVFTMLGCTALSAAWYWYSGLTGETRPDIKTCVTMVALPLALIVFRPLVNRILAPIQGVRRKIPRFLLLGIGIAVPFFTANYLYAAGNTQFDYMFKTVVVSTLASHIVLKNVPMSQLRKLVGGVQ